MKYGNNLASQQQPGLLTSGRVPGDLHSAANQSTGHDHFPWHSWNSPTPRLPSFSYQAMLKLFALSLDCQSMHLSLRHSFPACQTHKPLHGGSENLSTLLLLTRNWPGTLLQLPLPNISLLSNDKPWCQRSLERSRHSWLTILISEGKPSIWFFKLGS